MNKYLIILLSFFSLTHLQAQNTGPAIGQWKSFLSYNSGTDCDYSTDYIYVGTQTGFFTFDINDETIQSYSKINGMKDMSISSVHHNSRTGKTVIGYQNGNIDVFKDGRFENIPDFMISTLPGEKRIYNITSYETVAYASTSMGLVAIDIEKLEIAGTTQFYEGSIKAEVLSAAVLHDSIFVATNVGVFKTKMNQPFFQDFRSWDKISDVSYNKIVNTESRLYVLKDNTLTDSVFQMSSSGSTEYVFSSAVHIGAMDADVADGIFVGTDYSSGVGEIYSINKDKEVASISVSILPKRIIRPVSTQVYFVDAEESNIYGGLRRVTSPTSSATVNPLGPESRYVFDISVKNSELWIAHGRHSHLNWLGMNSRHYFSSYKRGEWRNYAPEITSNGWRDYVVDASRILKDHNTGKVYIGFANGGLIEMDKDDNMTLYRSGVLDGAFGDTSTYKISGLALDVQGNLWMTNYAGNFELKVKTKEGDFYKYHSSVNPNRFGVDVIIDDFGTKWFYATFDGGLIAYNDNKTLDNTSDDITNVFKAGKDFGNLPSNNVQCLAKDRNNTIWVGTNNGIGIFNSPLDALNGTGNDTAELRPVKYEGDFDYKRLFTGQSVTSIAVDGDNQKWIGTSNNGVFLISSDAQELIHHFTIVNSPLPSNEILRIQIDDVTGDVYFATTIGLMAYRGKSTAPKFDISEELITYPNPVPSGYEGYISIKDLKTRCEVKITDINGYLIAQFETNGGQAVWNGKDYNGRRPQSGVYLIFISDRTTGKMIKSGKIIFEH